MSPLRNVFEILFKKYSADERLIAEYWKEIEEKYSGKGRHYHTLSHLEYMYGELLPVKDKMLDWEAALFALFYHDMIYNVLKNDNEERSADIAQQRLAKVNFPGMRAQRSLALIIATKKHELTGFTDVDLFTDADLSVLGAPFETYRAYAENVRKEYSVYPDLLYKPGRKKVLQHFLGMPSIFKTTFFSHYEQQARENIAREIALL
jgi:predicted metal-dependent HD superfamily phosphohydrolase